MFNTSRLTHSWTIVNLRRKEYADAPFSVGWRRFSSIPHWKAWIWKDKHIELKVVLGLSQYHLSLSRRAKTMSDKVVNIRQNLNNSNMFCTFLYVICIQLSFQMMLRNETQNYLREIGLFILNEEKQENNYLLYNISMFSSNTNWLFVHLFTI